MKKHKILIELGIMMLACSCIFSPEPQAPSPDILPLPLKMEQFKGAFNAYSAEIYCDPAIEGAALGNIKAFAHRLSVATGRDSEAKTALTGPEGLKLNRKHAIYFIQDTKMGEDEYSVDSQKNPVVIKAGTRSGFINAIATLQQMMPVEIYSDSVAPVETNWHIARVRLQDRPLMSYRGMHMDCSRHFFSVDEVKRYLRVMSFYKLNRFHWHLTDDQGWRIEIKSHPELTEIGAWRDGTVIQKDWDSDDGVRHGGFYSQKTIREIIHYADSLGITIIPEIDLPGHMQAVLAAHPELGCTGGPYKVWQRWGISEDVLCVGRDATMKLLFEVLGEVCDLFPSEYIHIGGDECPKVRWKKCPRCQARIRELGLRNTRSSSAEQKLQGFVTTTVEDFLAKKGKKVIGWDEILDSETNDSTVIMSWRGTKGGIKAINRGMKCIMTPNSYLYFDYYQSENRDAEPFAIGGHLPLERVYSYNPYEGLESGQYSGIIGVQANLWTEYISTPEHLEYMLMPRLQALCELQWCPYSTRDIERLKRSLREHQFPILESLGYNYRPLD